MWTIYRVNVLKALISGRYSKDSEKFANFIATEYDTCIKRGGDTIYGVPVINGNVKAMASVIKNAIDKGRSKPGSNFNLLQEICPAAFDAYWIGAEMSPFPNPIFKPLGWASTPPAPGTIQNLGPDMITLATNTAKNKALVEAIKVLIDEIKDKVINVPGIGDINVYETAVKIEKGEKIQDRIQNNPIIKSAVELLKRFKEAKKKKPSIGAQFKKSLEIPFPELPDRQKIIKETKEKLLTKVVEQLIQRLSALILEQILEPYVSVIDQAVNRDKRDNKITKEQIKTWVKEQINGMIPSIELPDVPNLPKIPTKEQIEEEVNSKLPTKEQLKSIALAEVEKLMPDIPYFQFTPPSLKFKFSNVFINPFINYAKQHLINTGGTMTVFSQYPLPAPPAPAIIVWSGYRVLD